jgi:hypothetical protein
VIESNAFQLFLVHDEEIRRYLANRGVRMVPHYTGRNKQDPDFGVASVAPLFGSLKRMHDGSGRADHQNDNLIELPRIDGSYGMKTLVEELITWQPGKRGKQLRMDGPWPCGSGNCGLVRCWASHDDAPASSSTTRT